MQRLTMLLLSILLCNLLCAQTDSNACDMYRRGFFTYTDSLGRQVLVDRQNRYQYEKNIVTKVKTQFRITWTGPCAYEILQTLTNSKAARKYKYNTSKVIISTTHGSEGYDYSCDCPGDSSKGKGYMKKLTKKEYYALF